MNNRSDSLTHRSLAASCFNKTWEYLRKRKLTAKEAEEMIHVSHASFWHWNQVEDHTPLNISIGTWQLARVYAVAGLPERAEYFAQRCIEIGESNDLPPYFVGYGYEAKARAKALQGERQAAQDLVSMARRLADQIQELDDRMVLLDDLNAIL
ncbi:MAG: hypothetical protein OXH11_01840 [Candidatus Aminicenantes bacterium]|nr:hypothetical protein [Candidatus Aminicenantes bacterium]